MRMVYKTSYYPEALIKKSILESHGIHVFVENLNAAGGAMPELGFTLGYRIMVPDPDAKDALQLIQEEASEEDSQLADDEISRKAPEQNKLLLVVVAGCLLAYFGWMILNGGYVG